MIRPKARSMICIVAMMFFPFPAFTGEIFISSRLETQVGYENNRMVESGSGDGSPFCQATPGLDVTVFGEKTETSLFFNYRRTQYAKGDFESKDGASAFARWRYFGGQNEAGASVGGGLYRDQALSDDDYSFWEVRPYNIYMFQDFPAELSLKGIFQQMFYNTSMSTSETDRSDVRLDFRPGLQWHLSHRATVWVELYAERNVSDASAAEYSGFGGAIGCELRPMACLAIGAWAEMGERPYKENVKGEDRSDTPRRGEVMVTYRLRPWLELISSADWESFMSTIEDHDYSWWCVRGGVRLVFDHELVGR